MRLYKIEAGTMLYDRWNNRIGWVLGKHKWYELGVDDDDWDVEWSNGKKDYYGGGSLQIFVNDYLAIKKNIIK